MKINSDNIGHLWRDLSLSPPGIMFQVILEAVLSSKSDSGLAKESNLIIL